MSALINFKKNLTSYDGEDGIIDEIFKRIGTKNKWCMEFGARDGILASNTRNLILQDWFAILIEPNKFEYSNLKNNYKLNNKVFTENIFVDYKGSNTVDKLLQKYSAPIDIDFINIDIDSYDYQILDSITKYKPRVICIEYNSSIELDSEFIQPEGLPPTGSSLLSIRKLGEAKGYILVYAHENNAFLIRQDVFLENNLKLSDNDFQKEKVDSLEGKFILSHNGSIILITENDRFNYTYSRIKNNSDPNVLYIYNAQMKEYKRPFKFYTRKILRKTKNIVRDSFVGKFIYPFYMKFKNELINKL